MISYPNGLGLSYLYLFVRWSQDTGLQRNKENKVQNISMGRSKKGTLNIAQEGLRSTPGDPEKGKDGMRLNSTTGDPEKGGTGRGRPEQEESRLLNYLMSTYDRNIIYRY